MLEHMLKQVPGGILSSELEQQSGTCTRNQLVALSAISLHVCFVEIDSS